MTNNARELRQDARRERLRIFWLCVPSLALGVFVLFAPLLWMIWQSVYEDGHFTSKYYIQIIHGGAYLHILSTTFQISAMTTGLCVSLGYPLAYLFSQLSPRTANLAMLGVLVPFWTSVLVRTYAWLVLLQRNGLINQTLMRLGLIHEPLPLAYNWTATVIGMTHVLLPFIVLPLYANMKAISKSYAWAAASLGASPIRSFWNVFFPLSLPGLLAGLVLVFVLCLGFYITPAILGGGRVVMIAQRVSDSVSLYPTWGPASALGAVLLLLTTLILVSFSRLLRRYQQAYG
jgi:ABC-type spermidine/putrescine transport system permease subunit I